MSGDTKPQNYTKCCSKCNESKLPDKFIAKRNICKDCSNKRKKELLIETYEKSTKLENKCNTCNIIKPILCFMKNRNICKDCNNEKRRNRYKNDENYRSKIISKVSETKHIKVIEKQKIKQEEIGKNNKKCKYCYKIKSILSFRHNRLKCKDCERDDPIQKFKRRIRCRIFNSLRKKNKKTIEYLGCDYNEYLLWIFNDNSNFDFTNFGKDFHIDHVIPLFYFNLDNEEQQNIAFNWRNTTLVSIKENLSKNKKIINEQIEQHLENLLEYHKKHNILLPENIYNLFAKHLVAGTPLEPSLPLVIRNNNEDLG